MLKAFGAFTWSVCMIVLGYVICHFDLISKAFEMVKNLIK